MVDCYCAKQHHIIVHNQVMLPDQLVQAKQLLFCVVSHQ